MGFGSGGKEIDKRYDHDGMVLPAQRGIQQPTQSINNNDNVGLVTTDVWDEEQQPLKGIEGTHLPAQSKPRLCIYGDRKPHVRWTADLHNRFVDAVDQLGGPHGEHLLSCFCYFVCVWFVFCDICLWIFLTNMELQILI